MKTILTLTIAAFITTSASAQITVDFEDLTLAPESYHNGADPLGDWQSNNVTFNNIFTDYGGGFTGWEGFAYSNQTDNETPGFGNQYAATTGSAYSGDNYAVGFVGWAGTTITLPQPKIVEGAYFTNTTYADFALQGDDGNQIPYVREFGDDPANGIDLDHGNEGHPDFFKLTITGLNSAGSPSGQVDFILADYTAADNADDYIVDTWQFVDLSSLQTVASLSFSLSSTDNGQFGMNTPGYFAMDNLMVSATPEPSAMALLLAISGCIISKRSR